MKFCFLKLHNWTEPSEATKRTVADYLLSTEVVKWLHVEKIEVCSKCQKIKAVGSSLSTGIETRIINRKELLKNVISIKDEDKKQEQDYVVIAEEQNMTVTNI